MARTMLDFANPSSTAQRHSAERLVWIFKTVFAEAGTFPRGATPSGSEIYFLLDPGKKVNHFPFGNGADQTGQV